jgi:DNA-binding Lrp family transcriptional regulator
MKHNAFVLINCTLGSETKVTEIIKDLEYVDKTYRVYGVYDIVVKVNANDKEDLQRKVLLIRRLEDIKSTLTLLEINSLH